MAKRRQREGDVDSGRSAGPVGGAGRDQRGESKIEAFAEDLGRLLGHAREKADSWIGQRSEIQKHLTEIMDTANSLIEHLGSQIPRLTARGRRRAAKEAMNYAPAPVSRKNRRKLSAKARAAIAAAQKKRWAKYRREKAAAGD
jgi:thioredoxin-like negative regulator of GroEL